jgi:nicotinamide mononucleotide transporter
MQFVFDWLLGHYLEFFAFVFGVLGVWLTARQNIWCWPIGLANVVLSLFVFYFSRLYADVLLQMFYLVMTIYGWVNWLKGGEKKSVLKIRSITRVELIVILLIGSIGTGIVGWLFNRYTQAALPYWDSLVAVWGVIGTWAMARKIIQHWLIWIITDLLCVGIYFYKDLYFFTALYFIFVVLAVYGWFEWKKELRKIANPIV